MQSTIHLLLRPLDLQTEVSHVIIVCAGTLVAWAWESTNGAGGCNRGSG